MRSRNWLLLAFVVIGSVLFCMQDMWLVRDLDDYAFSTINELRVNELGEPYMVHERPVQSLADALASQRVAFVHYNGRFLIHSLSQWFNSTDSTTPAIIFNTLSWALLIACFVLLAYGRKRLDVPLLVIAFAVLWLTMPSSLWMMLGAITAAADYLWTGAANLFVLWIFYRITRGCYKSSWLKTLLIGVCALIAAAMQESFSIGIPSTFSAMELRNAWISSNTPMPISLKASSHWPNTCSPWQKNVSHWNSMKMWPITYRST